MKESDVVSGGSPSVPPSPIVSHDHQHPPMLPGSSSGRLAPIDEIFVPSQAASSAPDAALTFGQWVQIGSRLASQLWIPLPALVLGPMGLFLDPNPVWK